MLHRVVTGTVLRKTTGHRANSFYRGGPIVRALAIWHPDSCRGILTNLLVVDPMLLIWNPLKAIKLGLGFLGLPGGYSKKEINGVRRAMAFRDGAAYMTVQSAMPQVCVPLSRSIESNLLPDSRICYDG